MAGHNKWSKIKRQKAKEDRRRSRIFSKLIREITVAAREGGGDPEYNAALRLAIDRAREENMPSENIENAILRGTGELEGVDYEPMMYEGYGPDGVALLVECLTDNANRTVQELRHALDTYGCDLGEPGSVAWRFERKGRIRVEPGAYEPDRVLEAAIAGGAGDVRRRNGGLEVLTPPDVFHDVQEVFESESIEWEDADLVWIANQKVPLEDRAAERLDDLLEELDELDDVQRVWTDARRAGAEIGA